MSGGESRRAGGLAGGDPVFKRRRGERLPEVGGGRSRAGLGPAARQVLSPRIRAAGIIGWLALAAPASSGADFPCPGAEWPVAAPGSVGMSSDALAAASEYAARHGGGSGCIVRRGVLVLEWGSTSARADIKSSTKGSLGTTLLGLAVDRGLLRLDDRARDHYPAIGREVAANDATGWLGEITVRQLATMAAGFDDGRPPKLIYRPGTSGLYSNDTANMLAELLTLKFGEDLRAVAKREVLDPIGAAPPEWAWRDNVYRPRSVGGLPSREFASGITITHRALARIGALYLRGGDWNGRRLISSEFIREATRPASPAPWPFYGFYWGTNASGAIEGIPRDAFWALGLGDSFVAVCPSLDLVAVRLGTGSARSQLPGGENWGERVAGFLRLVIAAVEEERPAVDGEAAAGPPRSPAIRALLWAPPATIIRRAAGSDNWPLTWAADDRLYGAYGDGRGFEPFVPEKLSLGLARIEGSPAAFAGVNLRAPALERRGDGAAGAKASGLLSTGGVLYLWARNLGNSQLAWSEDLGASWSWSEWKFTESFGCPTFLQFGRDYSGARDDFVYVYSHDSGSAYEPADRMVLARVPKERIRERAAYEFFTGLDGAGGPLWSADVARRGAVFSSPGRCYRSGISYCAPIRRYLWCQTLPGEDPRFRGGLSILDAPEPWGPWTAAFSAREWDVGPGETSSLPPKWMSPDGRTLHLVFSGDDSFSVRRVELLLAAGVIPGPPEDGAFAPRTRVALAGGKWRFDGAAVHRGSRAEGLLMNARMVNSTFEDRNRPDFDSGKNTEAFIAAIPDYAAHGVCAFTLCLQGGMPGYEGAVNSAFEPDGSLRPDYLARVRRAIEACDRSGAAVILGCFYQRQDQVLRDEEAVRAGARNAARWVRESGFTNVLLEIANEHPHGGFDHPILRSPEGQVELIRIAREAAPDLLVSTSGIGDGRLAGAVAAASDFLLIHLNGVPLEAIPGRIAALKGFGKAIVVNEDDRAGEEAARAAELCVEAGASYGLMLKELNQYRPFTFRGAPDDPVFYKKLKELTAPPGG